MRARSITKRRDDIVGRLKDFDIVRILKDLKDSGKLGSVLLKR